MKLLALIVLAAAVLLDPVRDAWIYRHPSISWKDWHLVKWFAYFPPLVLITLNYFAWHEIIFIAVIALVAWRFVYDTFTKQLNPPEGENHVS